ncbi:MAG TPA: hypothetical protein DDZ51_16855 [Planctomycetaceae bacterium]|nr:hypothetical protein [Planctomycetaceae bacterium]
MADPDSHRLHTVYIAIANYSERVWNTAYPGVPKSAEHPIIEIESWKKAMAESLRKHDHRSPDATARNIYELGMTLHVWPLKLRQPSLLSCLSIAARAIRAPIQLGHLERICVVLKSHYHGMTAEEHHACFLWNQFQTGELLSVAIDQELSPKQLEIYIAKLQGKPTAGRPRCG